MTSQFIHLHCHSHYSLYNALASPKELVRRAKELDMSALALTDYCALTGIPEFCLYAREYGIKPILGMESAAVGISQTHNKTCYNITLLAMNEEGWRNLIRLSSFIRCPATPAFVEGSSIFTPLSKELLQQCSAGLICLSGFTDGEIGGLLTNNDRNVVKNAKDVARGYQDIFGDRYYLELRNHEIVAEEMLFYPIVEIGRELDIATVATHDIHYLEPTDTQAYDILLCLKSNTLAADQNRPRMKSDQYYFRSEAEMWNAKNWNCPWDYSALARTMEIADRIEPNIFYGFYAHRTFFPFFPFPSSDGKWNAPDELLRERCRAGLETYYANSPFAEEAQRRLDTELSAIQKHAGFVDYYLIIADIVRFAKEQGILYSTCGSVAGSLICYVLGISHECPLESGLLFECFLDAKRLDYPDIYIEIDAVRLDEVIKYVKAKQGHENVAQGVRFDRMTPHDAIKETARILNLPSLYSVLAAGEFSDNTEQWQRKIRDFCKGKADAIEDRKTLYRCYQSDTTLKNLLRCAQHLEGLPRGFIEEYTGMCPRPAHIVSDRPIVDVLPIQRIEGHADPVLQWKESYVGVNKFLHLNIHEQEGITTIARWVERVRKKTGIEIDPYQIPLDDRPTYDFFCDADMTGVFGFHFDPCPFDDEYADHGGHNLGMRHYLLLLQPKCFRDLAAVLALYRPDPLKKRMIDQYGEAKHKSESLWASEIFSHGVTVCPKSLKIEYPHSGMAEVLDETYGVMIYQEQAMLLLNKLGKMPLPDAYNCIKAICKMNTSDIDKYRAQFMEGFQETVQTWETGEDVFEYVMEYAPYGFCKAHAVAWAHVGYITAYLKVHPRGVGL